MKARNKQGMVQGNLHIMSESPSNFLISTFMAVNSFQIRLLKAITVRESNEWWVGDVLYHVWRTFRGILFMIIAAVTAVSLSYLLSLSFSLSL